MKYLIYFVLIITSLSAHAERIQYHSTYKGLQVGHSRLSHAMDLFGEPKDLKKIQNNAQYRYDGFDINFTDGIPTIMSIVIYDTAYVDVNGVKIGMPRKTLEDIFKQPTSGDYYVDKANGIIYWFSNNHVSKIALAAALNF